MRSLLAFFLFAASSAFAAYDPSAGRFISRDPTAEQGGLNLYRYSFNSPASAVDPLGQKGVWVVSDTQSVYQTGKGGLRTEITVTNSAYPGQSLTGNAAIRVKRGISTSVRISGLEISPASRTSAAPADVAAGIATIYAASYANPTKPLRFLSVPLPSLTSNQAVPCDPLTQTQTTAHQQNSNLFAGGMLFPPLVGGLPRRIFHEKDRANNHALVIEIVYPQPDEGTAPEMIPTVDPGLVIGGAALWAIWEGLKSILAPGQGGGSRSPSGFF
jgi:hypothetical protein